MPSETEPSPSYALSRLNVEIPSRCISSEIEIPSQHVWTCAARRAASQETRQRLAATRPVAWHACVPATTAEAPDLRSHMPQATAHPRPRAQELGPLDDLSTRAGSAFERPSDDRQAGQGVTTAVAEPVPKLVLMLMHQPRPAQLVDARSFDDDLAHREARFRRLSADLGARRPTRPSTPARSRPCARSCRHLGTHRARRARLTSSHIPEPTSRFELRTLTLLSLAPAPQMRRPSSRCDGPRAAVRHRPPAEERRARRAAGRSLLPRHRNRAAPMSSAEERPHLGRASEH